MTEANKDSCSCDGEKADFRREECGLVFMVDDVGAVAADDLE
jgi:hypothetical protein